MRRNRYFVDTAFVQALLNRRDHYHPNALALLAQCQDAEMWITEAVLVEIGDGMSRIDRSAAVQFIGRCYDDSSVHVLSLDSQIIRQALELYQSRPDKTWGLTDCISFVAMSEHGLTEALTSDLHFVQAGFKALMREA